MILNIACEAKMHGELGCDMYGLAIVATLSV